MKAISIFDRFGVDGRRKRFKNLNENEVPCIGVDGALTHSQLSKFGLFTFDVFRSLLMMFYWQDLQ